MSSLNNCSPLLGLGFRQFFLNSRHFGFGFDIRAIVAHQNIVFLEPIAVCNIADAPVVAAGNNGFLGNQNAVNRQVVFFLPAIL